MNQVDINLDGRTYQVACEDGQEERVSELAQLINGHMQRQRLSGDLHNASHIRLLVMTSLLLADEMVDLRHTVEAVERDSERRATAALEQAADRIEAIAARQNPG